MSFNAWICVVKFIIPIDKTCQIWTSEEPVPVQLEGHLCSTACSFESAVSDELGNRNMVTAFCSMEFLLGLIPKQNMKDFMTVKIRAWK